jgi:mannose/cellobiose epimerase-like protein (N-acyl-D-glucosamine 2-epimerase family)
MTGPATAAWTRLPSHRAWLVQEAARLLEFAEGARTADGFAWLDAVGRPDPAKGPQLWITTRMTHVFALGHLLGHPGCGPLVDHGLVSIDRSHEDARHGGWLSGADRKEAYPHAFVLLAAAGAAIAGRPGGQDLLERAVSVVETRFWSEDEDACLESYDRAWRNPEAYRGANANMHMVEAFLAAGDATGDPVWARRALRIAQKLIYAGARAHEWRIGEHFDANWEPLPEYNADQPRHPFRPYGVTPGHGLEWSRLLLQIRSALDAPPRWLLEDAEALFARAVQDGWTAGRGFVYTTDAAGKPVVEDRLHWVVAEAIAAAAALHAVTQKPGYEELYRAFWDFAGERLLDREHGSWLHELDEELQPSSRTWEGKPDVYHALQATILPRLPVTTSVAGALRDGLLAG